MPITKELYIDLEMAPKHKSSDAGNLDMPMTSHEMFSLSEMVKALDLIIEEKKDDMLALLTPTLRMVLS